MGCEPYQFMQSTGIVCSRGRHKSDHLNCFRKGCNEPAEKLCDFPDGQGRTCSRRCCIGHSRKLEGHEDMDYCLEHAFIMTCWKCSGEVRGWKDGDPIPPKTLLDETGKPREPVFVCGPCRVSWIAVKA